MTITRGEVARTLADCLQDNAQAEQVRQWAEASKQAAPEAPGLDSAATVLLYAAALGDAEAWRSLTRMQPGLAGLDVHDMPAVLDRLFARSQP